MHYSANYLLYLYDPLSGPYAPLFWVAFDVALALLVGIASASWLPLRERLLTLSIANKKYVDLALLVLPALDRALPDTLFIVALKDILTALAEGQSHKLDIDFRQVETDTQMLAREVLRNSDKQATLIRIVKDRFSPKKMTQNLQRDRVASREVQS